VGLALEMRHTAKNEQRDAADFDSHRSSDQCVRQLVEEHRNKKQHRGRECSGPDQCRTPIGMPCGEKSGAETECHEEKNNHQAPVDENIDSRNGANANSGCHV
jgi:hypothetical protein